MSAVRWGAMVVRGRAVKGQKASLTAICAMVTGCVPSLRTANTIVPGRRSVCATATDPDGAATDPDGAATDPDGAATDPDGAGGGGASAVRATQPRATRPT